jgi:predicted DNA-binding transcriptional regulator AlpA
MRNAPQGMLRKTQVAEMLGVSTRTVNSMIARGKFPAPLAFTERNKAWPESVVRAWMASKGASA